MLEIVSEFHSPSNMPVSITEESYRPATILDSSSLKPDERDRLTVRFSSLVLVEVRGGTWTGRIEPSVGVYSTKETGLGAGRQRSTRVDYVIKRAGEEVNIRRHTSFTPSTHLESLRDYITSKVSSLFNPEPYSFNGKVELEEKDGVGIPIFRYFRLQGTELMGDNLNNIKPGDYGRYN